MYTNCNAQDTTSSIRNNNVDASRGAKDLTDLPNDIFLLIIKYLSSQDLVLCRRVSRAWFEVFTNIDVSWILMKWHFPRVHDMHNVAVLGGQPNWASIFPKVARRYYHLRSAKPRLIEKIDVIQETMLKGPRRGVAPWNRWLRFNDSTAAFQQRDPTWCLDDGLLVYQEHISEHYVAYDLETRHRFSIPFDGSDRTVRRLRLACGVLVIEWCEREPYHQLNDRESVHRHFATAFDVQRSISSASAEEPFSWVITFRSEWKIHFLGLPLNRYDRFFSAHTSTHYALYLWQPNRSPWGEEDPLEQLTIWDISSPSPYRPSLDPTRANKPSSGHGPVVINRFSWRDLEVLGLRQRHTPSLREILLDDANVYIHEEEHRWLEGQHSSLSPPRNHHVRCTGIPFSGTGPRWFDECCADGDVHMNFCPRSGSAARISNSERLDRFDGTWPGWAPCWRHEEFPYLTVSEVVDARAGVRIVARQCFMMEALSTFVLPKISFEADSEEAQPEARFGDELWPELLSNGRIAGDERWVVGEDRDGRVTIVRF
ncbi:hypothetical protein F4779DRAFT_506374 [Xylariaceae sp. FL0662B]|nr:hypothetical protein F4779DRAFT_506374 [Xylariaceae sp. FL0662B]